MWIVWNISGAREKIKKRSEEQRTNKWENVEEGLTAENRTFIHEAKLDSEKSILSMGLCNKAVIVW